MEGCYDLYSEPMRAASLRSITMVVLLVQGLTTLRAAAICSSTVNAFPYSESFESGAANWFTGGTASDWTLGTPSKPVISSAGDGNSCWVTGGLLNSSYNPGERSWLQSPCFDFSSLLHPEIRFLLFWETEFQYDGASLQYSIDNGVTWFTLGAASADPCVAQNWYNIGSITNLSGLSSPTCGWSGTTQPTSGSCRGGNGSGGWLEASYCLPQFAGATSITFRFTFGSGTTCNGFDGFAIDHFRVSDLASRITTIGFECQSSRTIVFSDDQPDCRSNRTWDFGDGTTETNSAAVISHTYVNEGNYAVTLTADHACLGYEVTIIDVNILSFNAEITPVSCSGQDDGSITIQPIPSGISNTQITWQSPALSGFSVSGLAPGAYPFQVTANRSCAISDTVLMPDRTSAPVPYLGPDRDFCPGSSTVLQPSGTFQSYLWSDGSTGVSLAPAGNGEYWVRVLTADGCSGADTVYLDINCLGEPVFPSAFTPNGDAKNDVFLIYPGSLPVEEWLIYDRWGRVLFRSDSADAVWDGQDQPEGVYVCLIRFTDPYGALTEKLGRVTLVR